MATMIRARSIGHAAWQRFAAQLEQNHDEGIGTNRQQGMLKYHVRMRNMQHHVYHDLQKQAEVSEGAITI